MDIRPVDATLGAEVHCVDLSAPLSDSDFAEIEAAWNQHAVLIFPGQMLSDEQHLAFTRRFGRLEQSIRRGSTTNLSRLSNLDKEGKVVPRTSIQARFLDGNTYWHTDSSYKRVGAKASILAAHQVPDEGGETEWADMRAAYDVLSDATKARLEDAVAVHDFAYSHAPFGGLEVLSAEELSYLTSVQHSVVRTHPATGRKILFAGRHASHILGEPLDESRALLAQLTEEGAQPPRTLKHRWRVGDLVIWDNRCVLHRGHRWPDGQARVMVRTTVAGDDADNEWALI
jgi:alpha-ketoglutarate-dependent 2,4-dichlorophenoxyacetate dioxygenase